MNQEPKPSLALQEAIDNKKAIRGSLPHGGFVYLAQEGETFRLSVSFGGNLMDEALPGIGVVDILEGLKDLFEHELESPDREAYLQGLEAIKGKLEEAFPPIREAWKAWPVVSKARDAILNDTTRDGPLN